MFEGYGKNWRAFDHYMQQRFPKPKDVKYGNWYPFISPKGQPMAFYNTKYSDIRIVKLPSMEVVIDKFYSNFDEKVYASHTNYSTYVPCYVRDATPIAGDKEFVYIHLDQDQEQNEKEIGKDDFVYYAQREKAEVFSLPLAFNAWTIWACDYEFYVDILDLRQIDDGVLKMYDTKAFTMTRDGGEVRNYVKVSIDPGDHQDPNNKEIYAEFEYLDRIHTDRLSSNDGALYDMYNKNNRYDGTSKTIESYKHKVKLPWEITRDRLQEKNNV